MGLLKLPRLATLDLIFPVVAAFLVATTVFAFTQHTGLGDNPVRILIPPLATFLPGGVLTIATVELAAGQMIAGASRLVTGMVQLGLLAFGIVAAASLVGVDQQALIDDPVNRLGPWAPVGRGADHRPRRLPPLLRSDPVAPVDPPGAVGRLRRAGAREARPSAAS